MRVIAVLLTTLILLAPAAATPARPADFQSAEDILTWINRYRFKPEPDRLPLAVQAMSRLGAFRDPESSGVYIGFISGVIGANSQRADGLIERSFPISGEDHWAIVRAIAHSGLPDWKPLLSRQASRMPTRAVMISKYVDGSLPNLTATVPTKEPPITDRVKRIFTREKPRGPTVDWALDVSPEVLDMLWGQYFASGDYGPILRIVGMLPWSVERDSVDKLTLGAMAKYTLTSNAARDHGLLTTLKRSTRHQHEDTAKILKQVTEAADTMHIAPIRKEMLAAIEELKRKGPGSRRDAMTWGCVGEGAIALGCIGAAVAGQVALGLPCVIGGAVTSAALRGIAGP